MGVYIKMEMPESCDDCRLNNGISCYAVPEFMEDGVVGRTDDRPDWCPLIPVKAVEEMLNTIPAADVRPVVRGRWERMPDNDVFVDVHCKCSACGEDWWQGPGWFRKANFCPNCGAMMEES